MRIGFPGGPRLEWYDRNPSHQFQEYDGSVAPHGTTIRWTYTVPTGRKAFLEVLSLALYRATAPTTPGLSMAWITLQPSGGTQAILVEAWFSSATLYVGDKLAIASCGVMLAGDILRGATADASTGGTVSFWVITTLTEFSA